MDKKYPRYYFTSKWLQANEEGKEYNFCIQDAPEGCHWDTGGFHEMYRAEPSIEELRETVRIHVAHVKEKYPVMGEVAVTHRRLPDAAWSLKWFNHWTFDEGQTDKEVLESFNRYVREYERFQDYLSNYPGVPCLMGAEDRWRWKGENGSAPPCRCEGCKRTGRIFINH